MLDPMNRVESTITVPQANACPPSRDASWTSWMPADVDKFSRTPPPSACPLKRVAAPRDTQSRRVQGRGWRHPDACHRPHGQATIDELDALGVPAADREIGPYEGCRSPREMGEQTRKQMPKVARVIENRLVRQRYNMVLGMDSTTLYEPARSPPAEPFDPYNHNPYNTSYRGPRRPRPSTSRARRHRVVLNSGSGRLTRDGRPQLG